MKNKVYRNILLAIILVGFTLEIISNIAGIKENDIDTLGNRIVMTLFLCTYIICRHLDKDTI